jgi:hypothetical protein
MNYKYELERYLNNSKSKLDITNTTTYADNHKAVDSTFLKSSNGVLSESNIIKERKYHRVIEECLNFEDINTRKVR